jgi:preprotein translocase subunit SecE
MANESSLGGGKSATATTHWLLDTALYKPTQGRIVRQLTCLAVWATVGIACYRMYVLFLRGQSGSSQLGGLVGGLVEFGAPVLLLAAGGWIGYRLVNWPKFADFLISVEAEMNKVSWPSRTELVRASIVVIFTIFALALLLFAYDLLWQAIFTFIGVS